MRRRDWLIAAGLAAFVLNFLAMLPAHVAIGLALPDAAIAGPRGTLWSGSVETLTIGTLRLGRTQWSLRPLALLRLRIGADVEATWSGGKGRGTLEIGRGGLLACVKCEIASRMDALQVFGRLPPLSGQADVRIERLEVVSGWPRSADGAIRLLDMPLAMPGQARATSATGSYEAVFAADSVPAGGSIEGVVTDIGGPLEVVARLQLTPPAQYQLAGTVQARPGTHESLAAGLALLGPQRSGGGYEFSFAGSL